MRTSEYVLGIPVVSPGAGPHRPGHTRNRTVTVAHAVAVPVIDNPADSVCGVLVIAAVDVRWHEVWGASRCQACLGITG